MRSVDRRKVEDWLTRCRWLATTELDERTRARLDDLIGSLEQDLEEDKMLLGYIRGELVSRVSLAESFGDLPFLFHPSSSPPQSPNSL